MARIDRQAQGERGVILSIFETPELTISKRTGTIDAHELQQNRVSEYEAYESLSVR